MATPTLLVRSAGQAWELPLHAGTINVGRDPSGNQLVLNDKQVSRHHCLIELRLVASRYRVYVSDLGSANGTFMGKTRLSAEAAPAELLPGATVEVGDSDFRLADGAAADVAPPPSPDAKPAPPAAAAAAAEGKGGPPEAKPSRARVAESKRRASAVENVQRIERQREERRARAREDKEAAAAAVQQQQQGVDADFQEMINEYRAQTELGAPPRAAGSFANSKIRVCVRKRPMNRREHMDVVTCRFPPNGDQLVVLHEPKRRVDLTKYMENTEFPFDEVLNEDETNEAVYRRSAMGLVPFVIESGYATCFAYGQTGSGKTYTMSGQDGQIGIYGLVAHDIFRLLDRAEAPLDVYAAYFEIYGGHVYDLLNARKRLRVLESGAKVVKVMGLQEERALEAADLLRLIERGNALRASGATSANERSSRSHGIFQILLRTGRKVTGKLSLVDLAGNERGADTACADRRTRIEGAEINKSLLALKECIRALSSRNSHTPFRASKLTQVLKDSFVGNSRTVMIATVSPSDTSVENSMNTLRYAARVKDIVKGRPSRRPSEEVLPVAVAPPQPQQREDDACTEYSEQDDLEIMHRTMREMNVADGDGDVDPNLLSFHQAVARVVSSEEALLAEHERVLGAERTLMAQEEVLLRQTSSPDCSADEYIRNLEAVIEEKMGMLRGLGDRLTRYKADLREEEAASSVCRR